MACKFSEDGSVSVKSLRWALKLLEIASDSTSELEAALGGNTTGPLESMFGEDHFTKMAANKIEATVLQVCRTIDARLLLTAEQWCGNGDKVRCSQ